MTRRKKIVIVERPLHTLLLIIVLILTASLFQAIDIYVHTRIGRDLAEQTSPYSYIPENPSFTILVVGDSSAVGTGAFLSEQSVAGRIHENFPDALIDNRAENGAQAQDVFEILRSIREGYDILLIHSGANDIVFLTPFNEAREATGALLDEATRISDTVIFLTAGNIGALPLLPFPFTKFYEQRSLRFLEAFEELAQERGVIFVDLFYDKEDDPFVADVDKYFAIDKFHLSGEGYGLLYDFIFSTLEANEVGIFN